MIGEPSPARENQESRIMIGESSHIGANQENRTCWGKSSKRNNSPTSANQTGGTMIGEPSHDGANQRPLIFPPDWAGADEISLVSSNPCQGSE